ncbi:MAG TPA: cytochrome P450 [Tepidisphaeraceae bacterium]|nr:cytochrome P450 [Tepidisphaeraceae bacterium]
MTLFSDDMRRNPFPVYEQMRKASPLFYEPQTGLWMVFDYESVKWALTDHETFSSRNGPDWIVFTDPPRHTKLRALISKAFTPKSVANLEPRIRELSRGLLDAAIPHGQMDLVADFATPLPIMVIAEMLGIPPEDRTTFRRWNDVFVRMSYTIGRRDEQAKRAHADFVAATPEMSEYLGEILSRRRSQPQDDLLTRLSSAEVDGERLTHADILNFFQALLLAGSETTTHLLTNAILCFIEHPHELARVRQDPPLLPSAIEEVLRFRTPLQWMYRITRRDVELHGQTIPAGKMILPIIGSANRDEKIFPDADRFDVTRTPNPHIAFGNGIHFCMGAPLARLESRVALTELLERAKDFRLANDQPWEPREGLHVHGPSRLPIRFDVKSR